MLWSWIMQVICPSRLSLLSQASFLIALLVHFDLDFAACSGSVQCQCCAEGLNLPTSDSNSSQKGLTNSSADCPWFGVMCQHFCSRSAVSYSPPGSINCSGHGSCDPLTGAFCICDPYYVNSPAGSCTNYLSPPPNPMDPALW
jgi:hypothetical protein